MLAKLQLIRNPLARVVVYARERTHRHAYKRTYTFRLGRKAVGEKNKIARTGPMKTNRTDANRYNIC